jgi:hypothetical protein
MKFAELLESGRKMSTKEIKSNIVSLAADPRFAAVLALIERKHAEWVKAVAGQSLARDHGALAHCAGSVYATENVLGSFREVIEPSPKRGPQPPEE